MIAAARPESSLRKADNGIMNHVPSYDCGLQGVHRSRRSGFTLIELIVVVVCIAIVAALVMPLAQEDDASRVRAAGRVLTADLEFAQMNSIGRGADPCGIMFDLQESGYRIATTSQPNSPIMNPAGNRPYERKFGRGDVELFRGVAIHDVAVGGDDWLGFTATGALDQEDDAVITLRCGEAALRIVIDSQTGEPAAE